MAQHIPLLGTPYLDDFPEAIRKRVDSWLACKPDTIRGSLKLQSRPDDENAYVTLRPIDKIGAHLEIHLSQIQRGSWGEIKQIYYVA